MAYERLGEKELGKFTPKNTTWPTICTAKVMQKNKAHTHANECIGRRDNFHSVASLIATLTGWLEQSVLSSSYANCLPCGLKPTVVLPLAHDLYGLRVCTEEKSIWQSMLMLLPYSTWIDAGRLGHFGTAGDCSQEPSSHSLYGYGNMYWWRNL